MCMILSHEAVMESADTVTNKPVVCSRLQDFGNTVRLDEIGLLTSYETYM